MSAYLTEPLRDLRDPDAQDLVHARRPRANRACTFVRSLRRKLGDDAAGPAYIRNQRGVGYCMPGPGDS